MIHEQISSSLCVFVSIVSLYSYRLYFSFLKWEMDDAAIVMDNIWDCKWILCGELWQKGHYLPIFKIISDYNSNKRLFIVFLCHHLHSHAKSVRKIYGNCLAERSSGQWKNHFRVKCLEMFNTRRDDVEKSY